MSFWRDGVLQFIYPQATACILCGNLLQGSAKVVCRPCYLELIWAGDEEPDIRAASSWAEAIGIRLRTVSPDHGRMKQLLTILASEPDDATVGLAVGLLMSKAGSWLREANVIADLSGFARQAEKSEGLNRILAKEISKRTGIPYSDSGLNASALRQTTAQVQPENRTLYVAGIMQTEAFKCMNLNTTEYHGRPVGILALSCR